MIKYIFLDVETTGVDRNACGVWQIGGIIECGKRIEEFLFECDIYEDDVISQTALEINGMSIEKLAKLPDPDETYDKFVAMLEKYVDKFDRKDKFTMIAYGADFDSDVLRNWFLKNDDDYFNSWFWHPALCMMYASALVYKDERQNIPNFRLSTVADYMGIKVDETKTHNALYDAQITRKMYYKLLTKMGQ